MNPENDIWKEIISKGLYIVLTVSLVSVLLSKRYGRSNKNFPPPGPRGLPILGYLLFLGTEPFRKLDEMSKKYGNVFSLYMGQTYVVFLGNYEAVKEAFSLSTTLDRPESTFSFLPCGVGLSSVNGEEWAEQRKFCMKVMRNLGFGKHEWETQVTEEVNELIEIINDWKGKPTDFNAAVTTSVSNNVAGLVLGKKLPIGHPERIFVNQSIEMISQFFGQASLHIYFPTLCNLLVKLKIFGYDKHLRKMNEYLDYLRKQGETRDVTSIDPETSCFYDQYIYEMKVQKQSGKINYFNETNLLGNTIALLGGATDTTKTSLNWLFLAMADYPDVQRRVREELDSTLGSKNMASWEDRLRLPFTYATIMEAQRWKTIAPLNTSRIAQEDIKICGYDIPKGTTLIANNWGQHNDIKYWKDPENFVPERFLMEDGTVNLKLDSYVPFSYGKRNCPAGNVAMMEILLYFSGIVKNFYLEAEIPGEKLTEDAILGLTYQPKKTVLKFIPRHT